VRGRKTGGRAKGTPNKVTASAREAIELAFDGLGGVGALTEWARANKGEFYTRIWPKILALKISGNAETPNHITFSWLGENIESNQGIHIPQRFQ
jgi:hypothetical protein